jgi:ribonuclease P/MRP protein subunit POP5
MRIKHRYLLFRITTQDANLSLTQQPLLAKFREILALLHGDVGSGLVHLVLKYFNPYTGTGILRCPRDACRQVWSALSLLTKINGKSCVVDVLHVSGEPCFNCKSWLIPTQERLKSASRN